MPVHILRDDLLHKATSLKVIPTISNIMEQVLAAMGDRNSSFADLTKIVKYDQSISSKVISIANSAYYSRGIEIFSLERAMISIGFEEVKSIVMCIVFVESILKRLKLREEDLVALWKHSVQVACAAKVLAEKTFFEDPQKVYTIALLHDIGKVIFYMGAENYVQAVEMATHEKRDLPEFERERFGIDHQEVGNVVALKWRFPDEIATAIRYHHEQNYSGRYSALVNTVRTADRFFSSPWASTGPDGIILVKARDLINKEIEKIMDFLHVT